MKPGISGTVSFLLFTLLTLLSCDQDRPAPRNHSPSPQENAVLEARKREFEGYIAHPILMRHHSPTAEQAIRSFLEAVSSGSRKEALERVCSQEEYIQLLLPNYDPSVTMLPGNPPERIYDLARRRRETGLQKLFSHLEGRRVRLKIIEWKEVLEGPSAGIHKVSRLFVTVNGTEEKLDEIKIVLRQKGNFKVCVVTPG